MSDAISNYGRTTQSNATVRSALGKVDKKSLDSTSLSDDSATSQTQESKSVGSDQVSLSNVATKAMAQPDFDRSKVEAIKQAIKNGNYPISPSSIAQNFVSLESLINE